MIKPALSREPEMYSYADSITNRIWTYLNFEFLNFEIWIWTYRDLALEHTSDIRRFLSVWISSTSEGAESAAVENPTERVSPLVCWREAAVANLITVLWTPSSFLT